MTEPGSSSSSGNGPHDDDDDDGDHDQHEGGAEGPGDSGGEGSGNNEPPTPTPPDPNDHNRGALLKILDDAIAEAKDLAPGVDHAEELDAVVTELTDLLGLANFPILDEDLEKIRERVIVLSGLVRGPAVRLKKLISKNTLTLGREAVTRFKKQRGMI